MKKLVCGVGVNDACYVVKPVVNGNRVVCPFYRAWENMLKRCYNEKEQTRYPTYIDCSVCDEWLTFSNFKKWMETQGWQSMHLDKDLLVKGNKVYSPEACAFVDNVTNNFTTDSGAARGEWPIGVCFDKQYQKFRALCNNPFNKKLEHLGRFTCPQEAHEVWRKRKHELACQLAELQSDPRVAAALRTRYANPL